MRYGSEGRAGSAWPLLAGGVAIVLSAGLFQTAQAQGIGSASGFGLDSASAPSFSGEQIKKSLKNPNRGAPAALPGATGEKAIAPAATTPALMSPNDELFDAINRGDVAAARDALSRGAQLDAQDELGLTPIELSVDLGRNPITFLLLSMRASDGGAGVGAGSGAPVLAANAQPANAAGRMAGHGKLHEVAERGPAPQQQGGEQTLPKLFVADGGTPVPQSGFLGFAGH
jgi:hypothetical protein